MVDTCLESFGIAGVHHGATTELPVRGTVDWFWRIGSHRADCRREQREVRRRGLSRECPPQGLDCGRQCLKRLAASQLLIYRPECAAA